MTQDTSDILVFIALCVVTCLNIAFVFHIISGKTYDINRIVTLVIHIISSVVGVVLIFGMGVSM